MSCTLTIRWVVLAFGVLLTAACGGRSALQTPAKDAAVATLDVLLYDGVKNVTAMVAGPDGNLWLSTSDGTIARLTMTGQLAVFPVGLWESGHTSLARGPDGYLWLGSSYCDECSLARVATDGTITEVPVEDDLRPVWCLTNAPDGSVWFSGGYLGGGGGLGRIAANGIERARAVAPVDCGSMSDALALDAGGNAWLAVRDSRSRCIGLLRIAPDGQTTQHGSCPGGSFACSSSYCCEPPAPLVIGSDGNLWFRYGIGRPHLQVYEAGVARMSPSGSPSYFRFGPPDGMTLGPDGNIWFFSFPGISISSITPSGDSRHFRLPDGVKAQQIAAGPDGNLWLALKDGRVACVSLPRYPGP